MLTLQEELKQMIIENSLLKEKVFESQERFRRIEDKREEFISKLQKEVDGHEREALKASERRKFADRQRKQLKEQEG